LRKEKGTLRILNSISTSYRWVVRLPIKDEEELEEVREALKSIGWKLRFPRR